MSLDAAAGVWAVWDHLLIIMTVGTALAWHIDYRAGRSRSVWTDALVWVSLVAIVFAAGATT